MSSHDQAHRIAPIGVYFAVFGGLLLLTATTVGVAFLDLGYLNNVVALAVAATKATLVVWFFMEVRQAQPLTKLTVVAGLVWLAILLVFLGSDYISRGWLGVPQGW